MTQSKNDSSAEKVGKRNADNNDSKNHSRSHAASANPSWKHVKPPPPSTPPPPPPAGPPPPKPSRCTKVGLLLLHLLCMGFYLLPILTSSPPQNRGQPVLDELHIVSADNKDINGQDTSLRTIFANDYWGRPMNSPSSHKSWRPLTVLSFRYLGGGTMIVSDLTAHRLVNIFLHACIAELVSIITLKLVPLAVLTKPVRLLHRSFHGADALRCLTKLVFALHPTHVEVTANSANRGHLLAVLCSVVVADPDVPWVVFLVALLAGFLCSETFLFQVVPAAVTLSVVWYVRVFYNQNGPSLNVSAAAGNQPSLRQRPRTALLLWEQFRILLPLLLPRCFVLGLGAIAYYGGRLCFDTLSIPTGLIRPAENPFFTLAGWERVWSYSYVLAIHIAKAWDLDFVGFSHEYGHECIRPITTASDPRLYVPQVILMIYLMAGGLLLATDEADPQSRDKRGQRSSRVARMKPIFSVPLLWLMMHVAWMTSLFPISGIVKVGTFISDRIVVAASVSTSQIVALSLLCWLQYSSHHHRAHRDWLKLVCLATFFLFSYWRIYNRSLEWMDSLPLLSSSIKTCPRFAKAHLEMSKIYSGLYPEQYNLSISRRHLQLAEAFDPNYCDVHYQFAHVSIQEQAYDEFEDRITKAVLCPYTMGQATPLWQNYWRMLLDESKHSRKEVGMAQRRYDKYMAVINTAIEADQGSGSPRDQQSSSPLAIWDRT